MKTILITGSTDGIGKLAAIEFAKEGHKVLLHGRSADKLEHVLAEVRRASGQEDIPGYLADFSKLGEVEHMANQIDETNGKLDVLINNAGILTAQHDKTPDGFDIRFSVNYFAPYILTHRLLPLLNLSDDARIINVASAAQSSIDYDGMEGKHPMTDKEAYAQSKLAVVMWSQKLAQQQPDKTVIAVNPGSLLDTKMARDGFGTVWSTAEKGANILHDLALDKQYKNPPSIYYDNDKEEFAKAHEDVYDEKKVDKLIKTTDKLIGQYL